jgi:hypothetical protein
MARFITFNGITLVHPGGISRVDINALAQVLPGARGIVGLIGEADGGQPDVAVTLSDPALAKSIFTSGPLADAIRLAFESGKDPRIPGGASRVVAIKTNQSTQSTITVEGRLGLGTAGENQMILTSVSYGAVQPWFAIEADLLAPDRYQMTINEDPITEVISDVGGRPLFGLELNGPEEEIVHYRGTATGTALNVFTILDTAVPATLLADMYVRIISSSAPLIVGEVRRITAFTPATDITVSDTEIASGFAAIVPINTVYEVYSHRVFTVPLTAVTNGANPTLTLNDTNVAGNAVKESAAGIAANRFDGLMVRVVSGAGQGQLRSIASAALVGAPGTAIVLTLEAVPFDAAFVPVAADQVALIDMLATTATITGTAGQSTQLQTTVTWGTSVNAVPAPAVDQTIVLNAIKTLADLATEINATVAVATQPTAGSIYNAFVGPGRSPLVIGNTFDFDNLNAAVDLRMDYTTGVQQTTKRSSLMDDLQSLIDAINSYSGIITAVRSTTVGATPALTGAGATELFSTAAPLFLAGGARGIASNTNYQDAFNELLNHRVNTVVPLISRDASNEPFGSTATINAVIAQCISHLGTAAGPGRSERNAYMGVDVTGVTANQQLATLLSIVSANATFRAHMNFQRNDNLDVDGNLITYPEWGMSVLAAGMQAGSPVGEPLTFKFIKTSGITNPTGIDPQDRTTSDQLKFGGVMFSEFIVGQGNRWVHHTTMWLADDNLANTDGNVREVLDHCSYEWRRLIEDRFTGTKGTPRSVASAKSYTEEIFEGFRQDDIIVDSQDPDTGALVRAYTPPKITLTGDILALQIGIFPVIGINFETLEIFAQLPVITA